MAAIITTLSGIVVSAFCLPVMVAAYRLEALLTTWPLQPNVRDERRDAFEHQLQIFLESERRQQYRPEQSAVHLFMRLVVSVLPDIFEAFSAFVSFHVSARVFITLAGLAGYAEGSLDGRQTVRRVEAALRGHADAATPQDFLYVLQLLGTELSDAQRAHLETWSVEDFTKAGEAIRRTIAHSHPAKRSWKRIPRHWLDRLADKFLHCGTPLIRRWDRTSPLGYLLIAFALVLTHPMQLVKITLLPRSLRRESDAAGV